MCVRACKERSGNEINFNGFSSLMPFYNHLILVAHLPHLVLFMPANMQHTRKRVTLVQRRF